MLLRTPSLIALHLCLTVHLMLCWAPLLASSSIFLGCSSLVTLSGGALLSRVLQLVLAMRAISLSRRSGLQIVLVMGSGPSR